MKKKLLIVITVILCQYNSLLSQNPALSIPKTLIQGEEIEIIYDNNSTVLANSKNVKGVIYFLEEYKWRAYDLEMTKKGQVWTSAYTIPQNAALCLLTFNNGRLVDKGGEQTYCQFIMTPELSPVKSAYASWGLLHNGGFKDYAIPGFCDSTNSIGYDTLLFWFDQELERFPEERSNLLPLTVTTWMHLGDTIKAREVAIHDINYLLSSQQPTQQQLFNARKIAQDVVMDNELVSRINNAINSHFPNNLDTRDQLIKKASLEADPIKKEILLDEILKLYPTEAYKDTKTNTSDLHYSNLFQSVIFNKLVPGKDYSVLTKYIDDVTPTFLNSFYSLHVQRALVGGIASPEILYDLSVQTLGRLRRHYMEEADLNKAPSQKEKEFYNKNKHWFLTHADLLLRTNRMDKGLELADTLLLYFRYSTTDFNSLYMKLLKANGKDEKIIPHIKFSLGQNAADTEMVEYLKVHYIKKHGSEDNFEVYMDSLKSNADMTKFKDKLLQSLIKEKIDLFAFEEMNGGLVDMSLLKGKIIVIDFWATWCNPCKAALPGMQMAVDSYKKDPDVCFFFLVTLENKPTYKSDVKEYINKMGYRMTVLFDNLDSKGKPQVAFKEYSSKFGFSGIPHKMIIDGNGYLRWSSTGYHGSTTKLADEIRIIIEHLKKEAANPNK